jgi:hypothetical protein
VFPEALYWLLPGSFVFLLGYLPIQEGPFVASIAPEAERD